MFNKLKRELRDGRTLLQFGFLKAFGQGLGMIGPLLIAKFFTEGLFGSYLLAKMIVFFFTTLLLTSAQTPFIVYANQERAETGRISKSFTVQCAILLFSIAAFLLLSMVFSKTIIAFAEIRFIDVVFMCMGFIGIALKTFYCNLFMALGERIKNSLVELVFGGCTLLVIVLFVLTGNLNIKTIFLTYLISSFLVLVIFAGVTDRRVLLPFDFDWKHFKRMFNFTKWVMFGATAVYFINWADNIVLRALNISMPDIGQYGLAYQIFKGIVILTHIINGYFLPFVSEHINNRDKMRQYLYNKRPKIFALGLALIALMFFVVPFVFRFIYKDSYADTLGILSILLLGNVIILYINFYLPIVNSLKKYRFAQTANVFHIILKVLLNIALIPRFGLKGAAVTTVISYFFLAVAYELYYRIKIKKLLNI